MMFTTLSLVLVGLGFPSGVRTSHKTRTWFSPLIGSGQEKTGFRRQSESSPSAWPVLDPSKDHMGKAVLPAGMGFWVTLVLDLISLKMTSFWPSRPSYQMYSAFWAFMLPALTLTTRPLLLPTFLGRSSW